MAYSIDFQAWNFKLYDFKRETENGSQAFSSRQCEYRGHAVA
jgi:hypothetical protein